MNTPQAITVYQAPEIERRPDLGEIFAELLEAFLRAADVRETSKRSYRAGLERFFKWIEDRGISEPDRQTVLDFKTDLKASGLAANTVNLYLIAVRQFFAYCEGRRIYPNVARGVKGLRSPRGHLRDAATPGQVRAMVEAVDRSTLWGLRNFALLNLQARLGLRAIELTRLNIGDIRNLAGDTILSVWGKGRDGAEDELVLTPAALEPINDYLTARVKYSGPLVPEEALFCSHSDRNGCQRLTSRTVSRIAKDHLRKSGAVSPKLSGHSLRHFCITDQILKGVPILDVQASARHASIATTMRYFHAVDRIKNAGERFVDF